jgi:hypothetical protein
VEEREFLAEVCFTALTIDKKVRFAGVMDERGMLLVGEYRKDIKSPMLKRSPSGDNAETSTTFNASSTAINLNRKFELDLGDIEYQVTKFIILSLG